MASKNWFIALLLSLVTTGVYANEITVVESVSACRYIVVEKEEGFLPLRLQEGSSIPQKGRALGGTVDGSQGMVRLRVLATSEVIWAYNNSNWMTRAEALREFHSRCT